MEKEVLKKCNELQKEIKSIEESLKGLEHLRSVCAGSYVSSCLTYHEIPISDNIKDNILDIIEDDLYKDLKEAEKELHYLGEEENKSNTSPVQSYLSKTVDAILNHLNKVPETHPDGSVILKDRKG